MVKIIKTYLCLFVCMINKAVHHEFMTDPTTEAFIAALTQFVSHRGLCGDLHSDCGTNFIGANTFLKRIINDGVKSYKDSEEINDCFEKLYYFPF